MRRDVQEIFRLTPHEKQCMMFSATLSKEIRPVCRKFMQDVSNGGELCAVASASEGAGSCRSPTSTLPSWHKHAGRPAEPLPLLSNWELRAWSTPEPGRTLDPAVGRQVLTGVQRPLGSIAATESLLEGPGQAEGPAVSPAWLFLLSSPHSPWRCSWMTRPSSPCTGYSSTT